MRERESRHEAQKGLSCRPRGPTRRTPVSAQHDLIVVGMTCAAISVYADVRSIRPVDPSSILPPIDPTRRIVPAYEGQFMGGPLQVVGGDPLAVPGAQVTITCTVIMGHDVTHAWAGPDDCVDDMTSNGPPIAFAGFQHDHDCSGRLYVCTEILVDPAGDDYPLYYDAMTGKWKDTEDARCAIGLGLPRVGYVVPPGVSPRPTTLIE